MKIAAYLGDLSERAEDELACRMQIAAGRLGHDLRILVEPSEITACCPDLILSLHTRFPKLSEHKTFGCMWNPPSFFANDPTLVRNVISYDNHLVAGTTISEYLNDLSYGLRRRFDTLPFYPSCYSTTFRPFVGGKRQLAYVGTNWDGLRYLALMRSLAQRRLARFFGPAESWKHVGDAYAGSVPFNGTSLVEALTGCGIVLCLSRPEHVQYGIPTMRVFEAAASSSIIISDEHPFVREFFGECAYFIDTTRPNNEIVEQLMRIVSEVNADPAAANERARAGHAIFADRFALEVLLEAVLEAASPPQSVASTNPFGDRRRLLLRKQPSHASIECIVRAGGRSPALLTRALSSLAAQTLPCSRVILVNNFADPLVRKVMQEFSSRLPIEEITVENPAGRSDSLWRGLTSLRGEFFAILDDDDRIHPEHFESLLAVMERQPESVVVYGGAIKVVETGEAALEPNGGEATRELAYLEPFDDAELLEANNFIPSNSFLAKTSALSGDDFQDPHLDALEDLWLLVCLVRKGPFSPSWRVTSEFFWRDKVGSNVSYNRDLFVLSRNRLRTRLQFVPRKPKGRHIEAPLAKLPAWDIWSDDSLTSRRTVKIVNETPEFESVDGFVEQVQLSDNILSLDGWASWHHLDDEQVLLLTGIEGVVEQISTIPRPDVVRHKGNDAFLYSGFNVRVRLSGPMSPHLTVFSSSDGGPLVKLHFLPETALLRPQ